MENLINQTGLSAWYVSGVTDFDTFTSTTTFFNTGHDVWLAASNTQLPSTLDFDLGAAFSVDGIAIWNNSGLAVINSFSLIGSMLADFNVYTDLGTFSALNVASPAQVFSFAPATVQFIRLTINSNFGSTNHAGASGEIAFREAALAYSCIGFEPPLADGPVTVKKNRVLPLKAELVDGDGFVLGDGDLTAPPVVQVIYDSGIFGELPDDVSDDALAAGQGTDGNRFVFNDDSWWQFNLKTKNYEAPGTYTISMISGDGAEYAVAPTCEAQFVIE